MFPLDGPTNTSFGNLKNGSGWILGPGGSGRLELKGVFLNPDIATPKEGGANQDWGPAWDHKL